MNDTVGKVFGAVAKLTGNYTPKIWLLGDGRSGTTWLSECLSCSGTLHYFFEPIHPEHSPPLEGRELFFDVSKDDEDPALEGLMQDVFSNQFDIKRIRMYDRAKFPKGILVKDIFGHLVINFVLKKVQDIQAVLLIRHPASVALSKMSYSDWNWKTEPLEFFERESLKEYLAPYKEAVEKAPSPLHKHVLVWCIIHRHVFDHVDPSKLKVVFFEDLTESPEKVLKLAKKLSVPISPGKLNYKFSIPSASVQDNVMAKDPAKWKNEISPEVQKDISNYLELFGLNNLYDLEGMPTGHLPF